MLCLCLTALFPGAGAQAQTITTYSNSSTASIPDKPCPSTVNRTFTVGTSHAVGDVDIGILLDHTYRRDLEITLTSPTGTVVTLMDYVGGGANNLNVKFDDEATGSDESDPYGASLAGSTITVTAATLAPASSFALTFQVTLD